MLITELKAKRNYRITGGRKKSFYDQLPGCKEVHFPEKESVELRKELVTDGKLTGFITTDYICNPENMKSRLEKHRSEIDVARRCTCSFLWSGRTDNCRIPVRQAGICSL